MRILFVLFILAGLSANAQRNWKAGSYKDANGQVHSGFINYKEWFKNPSSIEFSTNGSGNDLVNISRKDLLSFAVDDQSYESYYCRLSMDQAQISHVGKGLDTSFKMDQILLKVLVKGKITLYQYTDEIKTRYYILTEGSNKVPEELVYHIYEPLDKETTLTEEKGYILQLIAAGVPVSREPKITRKIEAARYDDDDLIPVIRSLNSEGKEVRAKKIKGYLQPFIGAGMSFSSTSLAGDRGFSLATSEYQFENTSSPIIFAGVDLYIGPNTAKMFIRTNASISSFTEKATAKRTTLEYNYSYDLSYKYSLTCISMNFAYNLIKTDHVSGYLGAGPVFHLIKQKSFREHVIRQSPVDPNIRNEYDVLPKMNFEPTSIQFMLISGVTINQMIDIGLQYKMGDANVIQLLAVKNKTSYFDLTAAFKFPRKK